MRPLWPRCWWIFPKISKTFGPLRGLSWHIHLQKLVCGRRACGRFPAFLTCLRRFRCHNGAIVGRHRPQDDCVHRILYISCRVNRLRCLRKPEPAHWLPRRTGCGWCGNVLDGHDHIPGVESAVKSRPCHIDVGGYRGSCGCMRPCPRRHLHYIRGLEIRLLDQVSGRFWVSAGSILTTRSVPLAFIPAAVLFFVWPKDYQLFVKIPMRNLDYFGAVLVLAGTVLPVFILNQAAIKDYAWNSAPTIVIFILSGLCWITVIWWQWEVYRNPKYRAVRPQLPFRIISSRVMLAAIL